MVPSSKIQPKLVEMTGLGRLGASWRVLVASGGCLCIILGRLEIVLGRLEIVLRRLGCIFGGRLKGVWRRLGGVSGGMLSHDSSKTPWESENFEKP